MFLIDSLRKKITEKDWQSLLVGGRDPKVQWSAFSFDREHVLEQAQAICHAIKILYDHKLCFRKNNTACSAKEKAQKLEANVLHMTSTNDEQSLNLEHVQKFVQKAHDYKISKFSNKYDLRYQFSREMVYQEHFKTPELKKLQAEMTTNETMESMEEKERLSHCLKNTIT